MRKCALSIVFLRGLFYVGHKTIKQNIGVIGKRQKNWLRGKEILGQGKNLKMQFSPYFHIYE